MKRISGVALAAAASVLLLTAARPGEVQGLRGIPGEPPDPTPAQLVSTSNLPIFGLVQVTDLPDAGAEVLLVAQGLKAGTTYAAYFSPNSDCSEEGEQLGTFEADSDGNARVRVQVGVDLDHIGSVSLRDITVDEDHDVILACARIQ